MANYDQFFHPTLKVLCLHYFKEGVTHSSHTVCSAHAQPLCADTSVSTVMDAVVDIVFLSLSVKVLSHLGHTPLRSHSETA